MTEKLVQTVSNVNYNKGVFSLYFVGQNQENMAKGIIAESDSDLELKQVVHMPVSGFMYMVSMIKNMLEDPRMEAEFQKLVAAGFLPEVASEVDTEVSSEQSEQAHNPAE